MDSLVAAAARALAIGDALGALSRVALRDDPPALALRGVAMAQLGEFERARELLRKARRGFGNREALAQARCTTALAEIALATRDLSGSEASLLAAVDVLTLHGDQLNAAYGRLIAIRRWLLLGRVEAADRALEALKLPGSPPLLVVLRAFAAADIALRRLQPRAAREHLGRARDGAQQAGVPALGAEVANALERLDRPAAWLQSGEKLRELSLDDVAAVLTSGNLVVDACQRRLLHAGQRVDFARRPVLFALLAALAREWPQDVARDELARRVFDVRVPNESHRSRLRVEAGRLRRALGSLGNVSATPRGYRMDAPQSARIVLLKPPVEGEAGALLGLLADGQLWSTSALARALGASQRTVQRLLSRLQTEGTVVPVGRARARRWSAPGLTDIAPVLLLPPSF